ncbi:uncharacterized protein LAESUDRAFT_724534 [Laetiporus sulphureus 93-53]|uniref:Uncharacterized protein n=1 Tax=Laetiporus sulphureus 93-53 TaxID=1314785 RepID=A0A165ER06_9APHY|nr:uncharacterized protein LAESUDRAFT_724534 [Laetiporus sulphureus 93-53]KZT07585.1 hypothetical protein LAESUDRAFT_724534 [Laetiporus sulphureus 93-53]
MASSSFSRPFSLAGPGGIRRSLSRSNSCPFIHANAASTSSTRRPNKHELEAVLAHAKVRAEARKVAQSHNSVGLGLPPKLSPAHVRTLAGKPVPASGGAPPHLMFGSTVRPQSPAAESDLFSPAIPFSPELALARIPPFLFDAPPTPAVARVPPFPSAVLRPTYPTRPRLYRGAPYVSPRQPLLPPHASQIFSPTVPRLSALGTFFNSLSPVVDIGVQPAFASELDPIVTPDELGARNVRLTPGAPTGWQIVGTNTDPVVAANELVLRDCRLTPGALVGSSISTRSASPTVPSIGTRSDGDFQSPTKPHSPVGLGIYMGLGRRGESDDEGTLYE